MAGPRRPDPPPLETNDVHIALAGTVAWAVALVVLLIVPLHSADHWWRWVCVAGLLGGLFGVWYTPRLHRGRAAAAARRAAAREQATTTSEP
jgi:Protein of unknown function (DUF2530)